MKSERKEDAVSPVVGVMLMLVVTIIIAAVVAVFASGMATDTASTPIAQFGVVGMTTQDGYLETVTLVNRGGDIIQAGDIEVILTCDGSSSTFTLTGNEYSEYSFKYDEEITKLDNMTVSNSALSAGNTITLTHYEKPESNYQLARTGSAIGKYVEFTIVDSLSGNSISAGKFIVS